MSENKNQNVVIGIFDSEGSANSAIEGLKSWDKASEEIKLGAIGTIVKEGDQVKARSGRQAGKGAAVGAVVGVVAAVLTGGASLAGSALTGGTLGGITGAFFKRSLHLTKEEIQRLGAELDAGRVAVVVTCDDNEVEPTSQQLRSAGGVVRGYRVPTEAIEETVQAINAAPEAMEAAGVEVVASVGDASAGEKTA